MVISLWKTEEPEPFLAASNISLDHAFFVCLAVLAGRPASTLGRLLSEEPQVVLFVDILSCH